MQCGINPWPHFLGHEATWRMIAFRFRIASLCAQRRSKVPKLKGLLQPKYDAASLRLIRRRFLLRHLLQRRIPARLVLVAFEVARGLFEFFQLRLLFSHLFDSLLKIAFVRIAIYS